MTRMSCPSCGLTVTFEQGESTETESCPRCLARSSGVLSVRLHPALPPKPLDVEGRVREFLRRRGPQRIPTA
jgi:hypothetical protein